MSARRGFWRRNWWGLLALAPLLVGLLALHPDNLWERWDEQPRVRMVAGTDGWVSFGGARLRLEELEVFTPTRYDGSALPLPPQVRDWRATVRIGGLTDHGSLAGCEWLLVDGQGRSFQDWPSELQPAALLRAPCALEENAVEGVVSAHFLLPASAQPVGLRLVVGKLLPDYAWLEPA